MKQYDIGIDLGTTSIIIATEEQGVVFRQPTTYGAGTVYFSNMSYGLGYSSDKGGIQEKRGLSVRCVKN